MLLGVLLALAGRDALAGIGVRGGERGGAGDHLHLVLLGLLGFAIAALILLGHGVSLLLSAHAGYAGARDTRLIPQPCTICLAATAAPTPRACDIVRRAEVKARSAAKTAEPRFRLPRSLRRSRVRRDRPASRVDTVATGIVAEAVFVLEGSVMLHAAMTR